MNLDKYLKPPRGNLKLRGGDQPARSKYASDTESADLGQPRSETGGSGVGKAAGTSNRIFTEAYGDEGVPSGKGVDTGELLDNARAGIRAGNLDPYSILSKSRQNQLPAWTRFDDNQTIHTATGSGRRVIGHDLGRVQI